ncbi:MAG: hypothetical protein EBY17_18260 [Acidobacteriia bacterium]|nr:hypothetical protein [Terriglobia bacterium]
MLDRRDFLKAAPVAATVVAETLKAAAPNLRIEAFDYQGVRLGASRWSDQARIAREFYLSLPDDDILQGFRAEAGLPAPGKPLGGWCAKDSSMVLGQWLSGMSRTYRATGDTAMREKAVRLMTEWGKTVKPDGDCRMRHYAFDKMVCGLVDMKLYGGATEALPLLEKIIDYAEKNFERTPMIVEPGHNTYYYGLPQEWYTLSENLYRAYQVTGNPRHKAFAAVWHYHQYWDKFDKTSSVPDAQGVHAYSHVNTFSGAAMAYAVEGDPKYLRIIRNAYDYLQNTQCYATGCYGPNERFMAPDGSLGRALDSRSDTAEVVCGSWAGFKLARYLTQFTGESRYGDWIERLFYNGVGAALPLEPGGRNFYYSDYRVSGGMKVYRWDTFTCCSASLLQNLADYHNLIYYRDASSLYVNLYVPSEVTWRRPTGDVKLIQNTSYPEAETSTLRLEMKGNVSFPLRFRVPGWSQEVSVRVNGVEANVPAKPGTWATVERTWASGDTVEIRIPLRLRMEPVDRQHPDRVAVVRGPVVMALDYDYHDPNLMLPATDGELAKWLVAENEPAVFRIARPDGRPIRLKFRPYYQMAHGFPYLMYFDRQSKPYALW